MSTDDINPNDFLPETPAFNPEDFQDIGENEIPVKIKVTFPGLPLMKYATAGSAGIDLYAAIDTPVLLNTIGARAMIPCGFNMELPRGYEAQIRSRSGLAAKNGLFVLNSPGTVDSDYRGPIMIILVNTSTHKYTVNKFDRIAQMVIKPVQRAGLIYTDTLSDSDRGEGGFGSTGK